MIRLVSKPAFIVFRPRIFFKSIKEKQTTDFGYQQTNRDNNETEIKQTGYIYLINSALFSWLINGDHKPTMAQQKCMPNIVYFVGRV